MCCQNWLCYDNIIILSLMVWKIIVHKYIKVPFLIFAFVFGWVINRKLAVDNLMAYWQKQLGHYWAKVDYNFHFYCVFVVVVQVNGIIVFSSLDKNHELIFSSFFFAHFCCFWIDSHWGEEVSHFDVFWLTISWPLVRFKVSLICLWPFG